MCINNEDEQESKNRSSDVNFKSLFYVKMYTTGYQNVSCFC